MAYLDFGRAVRGVDTLLRQRLGIREITDDEECIFRVSLAAARASLRLSDGTRVAAGAAVLELHFWNEHLPIMPAQGPSVAWANLLKRRLYRSLAILAAHLEGDPLLADIIALNGAPPFASRLGLAQMVRTARRFGFEVIDPDAPPDRHGRLYLLLDGLLLWGMARAYNPASLSGKRLRRQRYQLWMSRARLLGRYAGGLGPAAPTRH